MTKLELYTILFTKNDASVFAELANKVVSECNHSRILYYQSDEIWHEDLIARTKVTLDLGLNDYSFWRYQLRHNFQRIKWFPHPVHRIGTKESLHYTGDGMNTNKTFSTKMVSKYDFEHFMQWSDRFKHDPPKLPTDEMILDVSLTGGFLENISDRRMMHLPFWNEDMVNPKMPADEEQMEVSRWLEFQRSNEDWQKKTTPFNIPQIMSKHVGKQRYELRSSLLEVLKMGGKEWR